jgi:hypothetical protein
VGKILRFGTDGSVQTPDPEVVETLTPEDVGTVIEALRWVLCVSDPKWDERRRVALAKFERIAESRDEDDDANPSQ